MYKKLNSIKEKPGSYAMKKSSEIRSNKRNMKKAIDIMKQKLSEQDLYSIEDLDPKLV